MRVFLRGMRGGFTARFALDLSHFALGALAMAARAHGYSLWQVLLITVPAMVLLSLMSDWRQQRGPRS